MTMTKSEAGKRGADRSGAVNRSRSLASYYSDPHLCKTCGCLIEVRIGENATNARKRTFCSEECNSSYYNLGNMKRGPINPQQPQMTKGTTVTWYKKRTVKTPAGECEGCHKTLQYKPKKGKPGFYETRKYCEECRSICRIETAKKRNGANTLPKPIEEFTKGELLDLKGYTRYKSLIIKHALKIYNASNRPKTCHICGYDHIQICHIKDVADFPDDATIAEINDPSNLIALCANHHREFDKKWFCLINID